MQIKKHSSAILSITLAVMMVAGAVQFAAESRAADEIVCGDSVVESPETCDDGNLQNGDGCSNQCQTEICGNGIRDVSEQCDDGNAGSGDGCNNYCQIEFCGDRIVQAIKGEQCDDGNGVGGDGCSPSCKLEKQAQNEKQVEQPVIIDPVPLAIVALQTQADLASNFLATPAGVDIKQHLSTQETIQLETILKKLENGRRLTATEREWAINLYTKLAEAKLAERIRYTDLLKEFIATPISSEVVDEKSLDKSRLVDVEVPIAIEELAQAVAIIRRGELQAQVQSDLDKLLIQGVDISGDVPANIIDDVGAKSRPIEVFGALKAIKEAAEKYASSDVPGSLDVIRAEAEALGRALPVFELEYNLKPEEVQPLLTAISKLTQEVTRQDVYRVVVSINKFMDLLEKKNIVTQADLASLADQTLRAAAQAERIADTVGKSDELAESGDVTAFVAEVAASAPAELQPAFTLGTAIDQRTVLLDYLARDADIERLRGILREKGRTDFDDRYDQLKSEISRVGEFNAEDTTCDDSMPDALQCVDIYLSELQEAVRGRNWFFRLVGMLQDFFGIGA